MSAPYTQLFVHLVWSTWDRLPLITPEIGGRLLGCLRAKCEDLGCACLASEWVADHVHLIVRYPASVSVSALVGQLKGSSSHLANQILTDGGTFRWQHGFGAFSISKRSLDRAISYVMNQKNHHAEGTTFAQMERCQM